MSKVLISKYLYTHLNLDFFICETLYSQKLSLLRDILARILDHIISFISTCGRSALWLSWHFFQQSNQKKLGIHIICQYKNQVQCTNSITFLACKKGKNNRCLLNFIIITSITKWIGQFCIYCISRVRLYKFNIYNDII